MPKVGPCSRKELVRRLRKFGFEGPYPGGRHSYMKRGKFRLTIPNPHSSQIDSVLIKEILKQAGIDMQAWLNA